MSLQFSSHRLLLWLTSIPLIVSSLSAQPILRDYHFYGVWLEDIRDIYQCEDDNYICVGSNHGRRGPGAYAHNWLFKIDDVGEIIWERWWDGFGDQTSDSPECLIETDAGNILVGGAGIASNHFVAFMCRGDDGRLIWERRYNGNDQGQCSSVIETKAGTFLLAGRRMIDEEFHGYAVLVDEEGEIIIDATYDPDICSQITVAREAAGEGFYFTGQNNTSSGPLVHVDYELHTVDHWQYPVGESNVAISGMESYDGDFLLGGNFWFNHNRSYPRVLRVSRNGEVRWDSRLINIENWLGTSGLARLNDGTIALIGGWADSAPGIVLTDRAGNLQWELRLVVPPGRGGSGLLLEGIVNRNQEFVFVGEQSNPDNGGRGIVVTLGYEPQAPEILFVRPPPPDVNMLIDQELLFRVRAQDPQGDSVIFRYKIDGEVVSESNAIILSWSDVGNHEVVCIVSDGQFADSVQWHVTVTDLYISAFTPDTLNLTLRRGSLVDFSIDTVQYVGEEEPEYVWTKTNLSNGETEEAGRDAGVTFEFPWSGDYTVEGRAYRGQSSDQVTWNVAVRGAIWAYVPEALAFDVEPDSVVHFEVVPSEPENESLSIKWLVDGEVVREGELGLEWRFAGSADLNPHYQVSAIVADSVEADTVTWDVTVRDLGVGKDGRFGDRPYATELLSVSPNPFNSILTIRFSLNPGFGEAGLRIYDLSGRIVKDLLDLPQSKLQTPNSKLVWNASSAPAGVYLVRLQSGSDISTQKIVLMR